MKLWKLSRKGPTNYGEYDSAVVAAETEEEARMVHPSPFKKDWDGIVTMYDSWVAPQKVIVEYLGETSRDISGVIVSSFNAG